MTWHSIKEKLPEEGHEVLVFSPCEGIYLCHIRYYGKNFSFFTKCDCHEGTSILDVTHWMLLPKIPGE
jgi:hypothetical protein